MNDPSFIVYDNRSGSTMLSALLDGYEGVAVSKETDFIFRTIEYPLRGKFDFDHFAKYLEKTRFPELGIAAEELRLALNKIDTVSHKDIISAITQLYFKAEKQDDNELLIIKGPKIQYYIPELTEIFPQARFIHIIRDGRAVYSSKKNTISVVKLGDDYLAERTMGVNSFHAAKKWIEKARLADQHSNTITIRYEDLLTNTDSEIQKAIHFCQPSLKLVKRAEGHSFKGQKIDDIYKRVHDKVGGALEKKRIDAWKEELTRNEILIYEWVAKNALEQYNYPLSLISNEIQLKDRVLVYFLLIKQYIGQFLYRLSYKLTMYFKKFRKKRS